MRKLLSHSINHGECFLLQIGGFNAFGITGIKFSTTGMIFSSLQLDLL